MFFMPPMSLGLTRYSRAGGIPSWVTPGPDGTLPTDLADYAGNRGWYDGHSYGSIDAYLAGASGTFSRGSDATYFGRDRILRTAGPDVLRLDHDPATGKALGARLEGGSTRETNYPIGFDGWSLWTGPDDGGNSLVRNAGLAPDGTMTANQLTAGADTSKGLRLYPIVTFTAATRRVRAVCLKEGTYRYARLSRSHAANASVSARIDLRTGEVTKNALSASQFNAGATPLRDGWWLCWLDWFDEPNPSTNANICITATDYIGNADSGWENSSNKPAPGEYIWVWGGVLQTGVPSSLILGSPTGSTTRLADSLTFARAAPPEGTVVIEGRTASGTGGNRVLCQWDDGSDSNRYTIYRNPAGKMLVVFVRGSTQLSLDLGVVADNTNITVAFSWRDGMFAAALNGGVAVTNPYAGGVADNLAVIRLSRRVGPSQEWFGTFARVRLFDKAYSPAQLQEMSA